MVISILIVIAGLTAFRRLPVAQFPDIAPPEISIRTMYVGADALTIEESVATPIEQTMTGVDNMIYMRSYNVNDGTMNLRVDFDVATDPNVDNVLTYIRLAQAIPQLPSPVQRFGISVLKAHTSPLAIFALYSPKGTYDATFLANYAYVNINDPMTRVNGIGQVLIQGAGQYAMRFWVKPDQLAQLSITITDLTSALDKQNVINAAGQVGAQPVPPGQAFTYTMPTQGRLVTEQEFRYLARRANPYGSLVHMRRGQGGTGGPDLQQHRPAERRPGGHHQRLPAPRIQRPGGRAGRPPPDGRAEAALPGRPGLRGLPRHDPGRHRGHPGDLHDALAGLAAGHPCRLLLSSDPPGHADSRRGRARVPHRDVHLLPRPRLLRE